MRQPPGAALVAIIFAVGSVSGAHLNPVVSAADAVFGGLRLRELATYVIAQVAGGGVGVIFANLMFSLPAVTVSSHARSGPGLWLGEVVATFGLLLVVFGVVRSSRGDVGPHVVRYIRWNRALIRAAVRRSRIGGRGPGPRRCSVPVAAGRGGGRGPGSPASAGGQGWLKQDRIRAQDSACSSSYAQFSAQSDG